MEEGTVKVAVLGCGPAGLFAAHAATRLGHEVEIYSKKRRSEMFGAQYLHAPIPELTGEPFLVNYTLDGNVSDYRRKVYGDGITPEVSPESLQGTAKAWDIREAYYKAWELYWGRINDIPNIDSGWWHSEALADCRVVISTIPAPALCAYRDRHSFTARDIWAIGDAPERGIFAPSIAPRNTVICNSRHDVGWYRTANILSYRTMEWPDDNRPPLEHVAKVTKPVSTNCDCGKERVGWWRAGRYGTWHKGYLSHRAYWDITAALSVVKS